MLWNTTYQSQVFAYSLSLFFKVNLVRQKANIYKAVNMDYSLQQ